MRNLKRALSLALASVMLLSMTVIGAGALSFNDADDITNISAATVLEALEVMIGDDAGNFNPEDVVTRAEMATILCRVVYGVDYDASSYDGITTFTDIDGHWAECEIGMAYGEGWINGRDAATFDPNATVNTYEAALMLQRALGYYNVSDTTSYDLPTKATSLANQLGMFDGVSSGTYAGLTRDKVAVAVYNTMFSCSPVAYSTFTTEYYVINPTDDKDGNAVSASIWTPSTSTYVDFGADGTFAADVHDVTIVPSVDTLGRPVDSIKVDDDEVATSPIEYDAIFTADTDYDDVIDGTYADDYATDSKITYVVDGKYAATYTDVFDSAATMYDTDETYVGLVVEIYDEYDAAGNSDAYGTLLVAYYYYIDVIADLDYDEDDDETTVKFDDNGGSWTYSGDATEIFEDDDVVMFTADFNTKDIATMELAEAVEGEVTGVANGVAPSYYYLDGTKYTTAIAINDIDGVLSVEDEAALYLNPYGYVAGTTVIEATDTAYDYLYVVKDASSGGVSSNIEAEVYFADGSSSVIVVSEINGTDVDDFDFTAYGNTDAYYDNLELISIGRVFSFDVDSDGYYELTAVTAGGSAAATDSVKVSTAAAATYSIENDYTRLVLTATGVANNYFTNSYAIYFTDDTVFVDTEDGTTYVGYENVPDMTSQTGGYYAVYDDNDDVVVIFILDGDAASEAGTYVYMDGVGYYTTKIDDETYKVFTAAYLNGEEYELITDSSVVINSTGIWEIEIDANGYVDNAYAGTNSDQMSSVEFVKSVGTSSITLNDAGNTRFSYDSDTIFVFIDADGDIYAGSKSDIETGSASKDCTKVEVIYDNVSDMNAIVVFIYEYEAP